MHPQLRAAAASRLAARNAQHLSVVASQHKPPCSADADAQQACKLVQALSADHIWTREPLRLHSHAEQRCPWLQTALPPARLLWAQAEVDDGEQVDLWFMFWLLSCITTSVAVCH